jgi:putative molybdopterin biosynthesis protein
VSILPAHRPSRLRDIRLRRGWDQQRLAQEVGISRQALSSLENGRSVPSVDLALKLARALGTTVEELFAPPGEGTPSPWKEAGSLPPGPEPVRVLWAEVAGQLVIRSAPVDVPADAVRTSRGLVALPGGADPQRVVWIAGCDPAAPLLAREVERRWPGWRAEALPMTSREALEELARGYVHAAGIHLWDEAAQAYNEPFARAVPGPVRVVPYVRWREGVVGEVPRRGTQRWAVRPLGSEARALWERAVAPSLRAAGAPVWLWEVRDHREVAHLVAQGSVHAGVTVECLAQAHRLPFRPLAEEPYDLLVPQGRGRAEQVLLDTLASSSLRAQVRSLPGYRWVGPARASW